MTVMLNLDGPIFFFLCLGSSDTRFKFSGSVAQSDFPGGTERPRAGPGRDLDPETRHESAPKNRIVKGRGIRTPSRRQQRVRWG